MKINDFKLEVYLAKNEFSAPYPICLSDCESMSVNDLLAFEPGSKEDFLSLHLGYTEVQGAPELRREIAGLYESVDSDGILVHVGAQEPIFNFMNVALTATDHVICMFPIYQSLFEVARSIGCDVSPWQLAQTDGGWRLDIDELERMIRPDTKLIVLNLSNNPTGYLFSIDEMMSVAAIARRHGLLVFCDEVYKGLEQDGVKRPWFVDIYENAVSMGVLSKAYGLAGLRIGWIATNNKKIYQAMVKFKHYTTICSSGPSEFLARIALKHGQTILDRNFDIICDNLKLAEKFFTKFPEVFINNRPQGGPIAFHGLQRGRNAEKFCRVLLDKAGVLLLPASMYDFAGEYVRFGYGRKSFADGLARLEQFLSGYQSDEAI